MSLQYADGQRVVHIPVKLRTPELQKFLDWLSFHWAEHFAESQNSER